MDGINNKFTSTTQDLINSVQYNRQEFDTKINSLNQEATDKIAEVEYTWEKTCEKQLIKWNVLINLTLICEIDLNLKVIVKHMYMAFHFLNFQYEGSRIDCVLKSWFSNNLQSVERC